MMKTVGSWMMRALRSRVGRRGALASALGVSVLVLSSCFVFAAPQGSGISAPAADPSLLATTSGYYLYTTNVGFYRVPVRSSGTYTGNWSPPREALPTPALWAVGNYWAPDVVQVGSTYYMYYSASVTSNRPYNGNNSEHAIGVACSSSPLGPFTDCSLAPYGFPAPVVREGNLLGAIDAEAVFDYGTQRYFLLWSVDWGPGGRRPNSPRAIKGCRLATNMKQCDTNPVEILHAANGGWELGTVENPAMVWGGDNQWHLFYSGGNFENAYATGEATCGAALLAACTRIGSGPALGDGWNGLSNIGGLDLFPVYYGVYGAVFHASGDFNPAGGDPRTVSTTTVTWQNPQ